MLGLEPGDAKILRNAGARVTDDVLRTLVLATHLLGVDRVMVVPHTDCRMTKVTNEDVHRDILQRGVDTRSLEFHTISDQRATLERDVERIRHYPFLPEGVTVAGCVYDVKIVVPPPA
jgi:carbonic anhydrase